LWLKIKRETPLKSTKQTQDGYLDSWWVLTKELKCQKIIKRDLKIPNMEPCGLLTEFRIKRLKKKILFLRIG
jgi:hypothetical protein